MDAAKSTATVAGVVDAPSSTLGKRPISQVTEQGDSNNINSEPSSRSVVQPVIKREKRITRSSLPTGGSIRNGTSREGRGGLANLLDSSFDGAQDLESQGSGSDSVIFLPLKTPILLTTRLLPRLNHYPPSQSHSTSISNSESTSEPSTSTTTTTTMTAAAAAPSKPLYRLMDESEFVLSRLSRQHATTATTSTLTSFANPSSSKATTTTPSTTVKGDDSSGSVSSDALYQKLHRYPEILEKRASRLERERLIHERNKLIVELEELRGRGNWILTGGGGGGHGSSSAANSQNVGGDYSTAAGQGGEGTGGGENGKAGSNGSTMIRGGRAEEERQRKLRLGEERLKRYDSLLPNQPRKSNFLNVSSSAPTGTPSTISAAGTGGVGGGSGAAAGGSMYQTNSLHLKSASPIPTVNRSLSHSSSASTTSRQRPRPVSLKPSQLPASVRNPVRSSRERNPTPLSASSAGGTNSTRITIKFTNNVLQQQQQQQQQNVPDSVHQRTSSRDHSSSKRNRRRSGKTVLDTPETPFNGRTGRIRKGAGAGEGVERKLPGRSTKLKRVSYAEDGDEDEDEYDEQRQYAEMWKGIGGNHMESGDFGSDSSLSDLDEFGGQLDRRGDRQSRSRSSRSIPNQPRLALSASTDPKQSSTAIAANINNNPSTSRRRVSAASQSVGGSIRNPYEFSSAAKPRRPKRVRLKDSFFHSPSQRDTFFPLAPPPPHSNSSKAKPPTTTRRSSARIQFAFGHRLPPDSILLKQVEFEPHGGEYCSSTSYASNASDSSGSTETDSEEEAEKQRERLARAIDPKDGKRIPPKGYSRKPVEVFIKERLEKRGEGDGFVVFAGRILPRSAIFAEEGENERPVLRDGESVDSGSNDSREIRERSMRQIKREEEEELPIQATTAAVPDLQTRPSQARLAASSTGATSGSELKLGVAGGQPRRSAGASTSRRNGETAPVSEPRLGFALPSVAQVLFASVPSVQSTEMEDEEEGQTGERTMMVDR